jgi:hypothetical protein
LAIPGTLGKLMQRSQKRWTFLWINSGKTLDSETSWAITTIDQSLINLGPTDKTGVADSTALPR